MAAMYPRSPPGTRAERGAMSLTVLSIAYPMARVSRDTPGGAEQILTALDRALVAWGHRSLVIARADSEVTGELIGISVSDGELDAARQVAMHVRQRRAIWETLARHSVDVIHMHGVDFHAYLPPPGPPTLVTLHLPPEWYPPQELTPSRPYTWLSPVSLNQYSRCPKSPALLEPLENGIPVEALKARHAKRNFALSLGRICPEKGQHLAIVAAKQAGIPLVIAGDVAPYEKHRTYFEREIAPRLDHTCRFIGPVGFTRKRRLLTAARCLLVTSLVPETSSLVAREALACGTPVVAFGKGALPETIDHGRTGFLVYDADDMASAIGLTGTIDPAVCRQVACERFSEEAMTIRYVQLYRRLVGQCGRPAR